MKINIGNDQSINSWKPAQLRHFAVLIDLLEQAFGNEMILHSSIIEGRDETRFDVLFSTDVYVISNNFLRKIRNHGFEVWAFGPNTKHLNNMSVTFVKEGEKILEKP